MGQFGEKLVKSPQGGNEPGIFKKHTHTHTKLVWLKCQGYDRQIVLALDRVLGRVQILGLCNPSKKFEFYSVQEANEGF